MIGALQSANIAHGDLQHGNVLVDQFQRLRLIDYDGMYVPSLKGYDSHEIGHRNYQHPSRTSQHFDGYLDNFSAWVIFYSIAALARDPGLWKLLNGGDECLLLRKQDFSQPGNSKSLRALENSGMQEFASHLRGLLAKPLSEIPPLDPARSAGARTPVDAARGSIVGLPNWLEHHDPVLPAQPVVAVAQQHTSAQILGATWILDHIVEQPPPTPAFVDARFGVERIAVVCTPLLIAGWSLTPRSFALPNEFLISLGGSITAISLCILFLVVRYRAHGLVAEKRAAARQHRVDRHALQEVDLQIAALKNEKKQILAPYQELRRECFRELPKQLAIENRRIEDELIRSLKSGETDRRKLSAKEQDRLGSIEQRFNRERSRLYEQLRRIDQQEQDKIQLFQDEKRNQYVRQRLANTLIANAPLLGIGRALTAQLLTEGYRCAADIDEQVFNVRGIGPSKGQTLMEWRRRVEQSAAADAPSPSGTEIAQIRLGFEQQRRKPTHELDALNCREETERKGVSAEFVAHYDDVRRMEDTVKKQYEQQQANVRERYEQRKREIEDYFKETQVAASAEHERVVKKIKELEGLQFARQLSLKRSQLELARYENVTFIHYLSRMIAFRWPSKLLQSKS